ncbi:hypothetical protein MSAN_01866000 [Mycena sanguinolenta]|uniref:Uncharacterized protein n=1 Tax=Mycena sanguinolenta TaxID=230812 RepID=A0A8H6XTN2_9AGAR|nr:hypothetical protein MSAN_01866000 [Mycena sanguinolenta]
MPTIPLELEREIFEIAIRDNRDDTDLKLNLSLVTRRVQYWVDLIQYELITITDRAEAHKFFELVNRKSQDFFAHAVKALCITHDVSADDASRILSVCTNVQQLACWVVWEESLDLPQRLSSLPLKQLSIEVGHFLNILLSQSALFLNLTHLDLIWWPSSPHIPLKLGELQKLTHVCISGAGRSGAESVCSSCASLQVLVVIPRWPTDENAEEEYAFDSRIVVAPSDITYGDPVEIWEDVVFRRPENMWAYAENVVLSRRQNLDGPC